MEALLRAAVAVRRNAHAPYSRFPVGAAVLAEGRIYAGCNVENSSFPLSVCAERNAVAAAIAAGARSIDAVAVVAGTSRPGPPCGGCRQVLAEFCAAGTRVLYAAAGGGSVETTLGALLPEAFGAADLAAAGPLRAAAAGPTRGPRAAPSRRRNAPRRRGSRSSGG
jgi:cytidine deaminase